jgi:glycosyltransferase involved in cell wall biosynthesis
MLNNKKILIVAPYGFNGRLMNFMEFITARLLAKNNWRVIGLTRRQDKLNEPSSFDGIRIHRYQYLARGICLLLKILIFNRPAIIHIYNLRNNRLGIIAAILAKLSAVPFIFTEYGLLHDHYLVTDRDNPLGKELKPNGLVFSLKQVFTKSFINRTAPLQINLKNYFYHWALTHADKIVFVSRHNLPLAKQLGLKNYVYLPYFFDDARWQINAVEEQVESNDAETVKKIESLRGSSFCLFVGQLKLRKGWDIYLKAAALIDKSLMPFFVVVTPSASVPPEYFNNLVKDLGIKDRIIFFGKINSQTLQKIYELCSLVVVPSRYEGFGLVAVEAFAAKKPLIASAVEALTETVSDGYNGLLVPSNEPEKLARVICELTADRNLAQKLIAGGEQTLAQLKSNEYKTQWLDFYEKLISK